MRSPSPPTPAAHFTCRPLALGDIIRVSGLTIKDHRDMNATRCESFTLLRHGTPPPPVPATGDDILSGKVDFWYITLRGIVNDAFRDDIDERYVILVVNDGNDGILVPVCAANKEIATALSCSPESVKDRINSICAKLGAANRSEAISIALRKHLLKI